jgi:DNA-binding transcriptional regulator YhcF (GntR family)
VPKYARVAAIVRAQIADGTLSPGAPAPSGDALARITGYSALTCRKAIRALIADGVLVPGPSRNARPRVAGPVLASEKQGRANAARALSAGLIGRRHAAGLTQAELSALAYVSVTTIGHAETGRLWQSRQFWERADKALTADGELLRLHDAYRAPAVQPDPAALAEAGNADGIAITAPPHATVTGISVTWSNGEVTIIRSPGAAT